MSPTPRNIISNKYPYSSNKISTKINTQNHCFLIHKVVIIYQQRQNNTKYYCFLRVSMVKKKKKKKIYKPKLTFATLI